MPLQRTCLSLPWVPSSFPRSTSKSLAISPGPSQVNSFPRAAHPNFAHFDPWWRVGSPMLSFLLIYPPVHPSGPTRQAPLISMPNYTLQIQRKIANLENAIFSQSIIIRLASTTTKPQGEWEGETFKYTPTTINETSEQMNKNGISFSFCQETAEPF